MSEKTSSIKRRLTLKQNGKRKKYFLKKKSWLSFGNRAHHFRYFDEDGFEVFDPIFGDIIFDHWYDLYDVTYNLDVECDLDVTEYNLFDDEGVVVDEIVEDGVVVDEVTAEAEEFTPLDEDYNEVDAENERVEEEYVEEEIVEEEDVTSHQEEEYVEPEPEYVAPEPEPERYVEPEPERYVAPEPEPERYEPPTPTYEEPSRSYDDSPSYDSGGSDFGSDD